MQSQSNSRNKTKASEGSYQSISSQSFHRAVFARRPLVEYGGHAKLCIINCPKGPKLILYHIKYLCSESGANGTPGIGAAAKEMKWQQKERGSSRDIQYREQEKENKMQ